MEFTLIPPHLDGFQCFNEDSGAAACRHYLPECLIESTPNLLLALCRALDKDPDDVHLQVCDAVVSSDREIQVAVEA